MANASTARKERKLTQYQISILKVLKRKPHTTTETVTLLNNQASRRLGYAFESSQYDYSSVHSSLRRLENRNYVRRVVEDRKGKGFATVWELTSKGSNVV